MQKSLFKDAKNPNKTQDLQTRYPHVDFCPQCGTLLKIANRGALSLNCPKCRFNKPLRPNETTKQNIHLGRPGEIAVIDKNEESAFRILPTVKVFCPTCGKDESETWAVAVGGETAQSTVTFFRCTTCGTTRREAG